MTTSHDRPRRSFWAAFGPGILFAGAAIGNSHLVQSTRAGALFGLSLLLVVVFANAIKYPAFRFGAAYAAATGHSLLYAYRDLGWWVLFVFAVSESLVHVIIIAASALTTAAILRVLVPVSFEVSHLAVGISLLAALIIYLGKFHLLDRLCKVFVAILTTTTVLATLMAIPRIEWSAASAFAFELNFPNFSFVVALMGFMPAGMSLAALQSLWVVAKARDSAHSPSTNEVLLDLNIGYGASTFLAVCFLLMGAGVLHASGVTPESGAAPFARQVLQLYATTLGDWSAYIVGVSVFLVIFTTLLTILDGFPRMLATSWLMLFRAENAVEATVDSTRAYYVTMSLLLLGSFLILQSFMGTFTEFIDFVTVASFIVAPLIALLNHLVVCSERMPREVRPGLALRCWSGVSVAFLTLMALAFLGLWLAR